MDIILSLWPGLGASLIRRKKCFKNDFGKYTDLCMCTNGLDHAISAPVYLKCISPFNEYNITKLNSIQQQKLLLWPIGKKECQIVRVKHWETI